MVICSTCNAQNEEGAVFCDQCGGSLAAAGRGGASAAADAGACPVCGAAVVSGDAFCDGCGAALSGTSPAPATPVPAAAPMPSAAAPATTAGAAPARASAPSAGRAGEAQIVPANGQSVLLAGKSSYLIGREDPVSGIFPEVDTTRSDGDAAGVSRRHAEIVQQGGQWFLLDLNSTNGSFVNNQRIPPNTRHPLQPGDQIRLGKWVGAFQVN